MSESVPWRPSRIAELLHRIVGEVLQKEIDVPTDVLITVSRVTLSPNHQHATVDITVYPFASALEVHAQLTREVHTIQQFVNKQTRMRPVPKIQFRIDPSEERAHRLLNIIKKESSNEEENLE